MFRVVTATLHLSTRGWEKEGEDVDDAGEAIVFHVLGVQFDTSIFSA